MYYWFVGNRIGELIGLHCVTFDIFVCVKFMSFFKNSMKVKFLCSNNCPGLKAGWKSMNTVEINAKRKQ